MRWENLTAPEFQRAVKESRGVCVVPCGVIEKHGDHLPLGTDSIWAQSIADRAAEKEPAIVFPCLYLGQILEAKHWPGTVALSPGLVLELLEGICDEIRRNGIDKIILLNGHGGNEAMLTHFVTTRLEKKRDYALYAVRLGDYLHPVIQSPEWQAHMESEFDYHAGEAEASAMLAMRPDLVKMDSVPEDPDAGQAQERLAHLPGSETAVGWYANFPDHYAGDARAATAEKGAVLVECCVEKVAAIIKAVKDDTATRDLQDEFFSRVEH